ncbi:hypothetical protein K438DRAFT_1965322 [Mycena galopus ATCC 62051]|nr:hypothetical protein K438DRAFT_1965322 [Mycena galopus ATCC 62051]
MALCRHPFWTVLLQLRLSAQDNNRATQVSSGSTRLSAPGPWAAGVILYTTFENPQKASARVSESSLVQHPHDRYLLLEYYDSVFSYIILLEPQLLAQGQVMCMTLERKMNQNYTDA